MTERFRIAIVFLVLGAIALGCYDLANPYRTGQIGFDGLTRSDGNYVFTELYAGGPAERAGVRRGDVLVLRDLSPYEQFQLHTRRAGQVLTLPIERGGKRLNYRILVGTADNQKPVELGVLSFLLILIFSATALLVAFRGSGRPEVRPLCLFFVSLTWVHACAWFVDVAPTNALAYVGGLCTGGLVDGPSQSVAGVLATYFMLAFVANFPPGRSQLRHAISRAALPICITAGVLALWPALAVWRADFTFAQISGQPVFLWIQALLLLVVAPSLVIAGALDGLLHANAEHRIQMRWVGSALIASSSVELFAGIFVATNAATPPFSGWIGLLGNLPIVAIAYAILRHRMVDVSIIISRAAIFACVSVLVVALIAALEWLAAQIVETAIGVKAANGQTGEVVRLAVAVGVGLACWPILSVVERRVNAIFFRQRSLAAAELHRFALEADVITNTASLLTLTCNCLRDNIEGGYASIYMAQGTSFVCVRTSQDAVPADLDQDDPAIVRLRRWHEPFEMNVRSHALSEALMLPMTIGGALIGLLVCGPKRERTHYLREEIDVLASVAHRVATAAYVTMQRDMLIAAPQ